MWIPSSSSQDPRFLLTFDCARSAVVHEPRLKPSPTSQFEHSSIPATVKKLFNLSSDFLTKRDSWAATFEDLFTLRDTPRTDCPSENTPPLGSSSSIQLLFTRNFASLRFLSPVSFDSPPFRISHVHFRIHPQRETASDVTGGTRQALRNLGILPIFASLVTTNF